jgi:hypothetical protein
VIVLQLGLAEVSVTKLVQGMVMLWVLSKAGFGRHKLRQRQPLLSEFPLKWLCFFSFIHLQKFFPKYFWNHKTRCQALSRTVFAQ